MEVGEEGECIPIATPYHHQNDLHIKMGSDESHSVSQTFEERGEPKRYQTEVLPLTSLTPYR